MTKRRDYAAEYRRRIEAARAAGKTRQAARGHARGEGVAVRQRPRTPEEYEAERERGRVRRERAEALKEGAHLAAGGQRFGRSLQNPAIYPRPAGVFLFVFQGRPKRDSPPLEDGEEEARVTIPIVPEGTYGEAMARFADLESEARQQASEYLHDPFRLVAVGTTKRAVEGK